MTHLETLLLHTATGAAVRVDYVTLGDGAVLPNATVERDRKTLTGLVYRAYPIKPGERDAYAHVIRAGATHTAGFGSGSAGLRLALDAESAARLNAAHDRAERAARQIQADAGAARAAHLRATCEVRRVLCRHGADESVELCEVAVGPHDSRLALPGTDVKIDRRCPTLRALSWTGRSWGSLPGCNNSLTPLTRREWDRLVQETADLATADEAGRTARIAALKAVVVPAAALAAYERWGGDTYRAWAGEDETGSMLISVYGAAIEAQQLAMPPLDLAAPIEPEDA